MDNPENTTPPDPLDITPKSQEEVDNLRITQPWPKPTPLEQSVYETGALLAHGIVEKNQLIHQVEHDDLTGLLNRKAFLARANERLTHAQPGDMYAMFFMDLDGFKKVNDMHPGRHREGDMVLVDVAKLLEEHTRTQDDFFINIINHSNEKNGEPARLGGDEFVMIVNLAPRLDGGDPNLTPEQRLERFEARKYADFATYLESRPDLAAIGLGISIGGVLALPDQTAEDLLAQSDHVMYLAKEQHHAVNGSYR